MTHSGLFWTPEPPKEKRVSIAPEPFWLEPDYLPGLEEARNFEFDEMSEKEIRRGNDTLVCDIEIYPNYFLVAFMSLTTGRTVTIEGFDELEKLNYILHKFKIVTFNGNHFDIPIMTLAIAGHGMDELKYAVDMLIVHGNKPWELLKAFGVTQLEIDHIDVIEVCPLKASLKIYGGRLHCPRMQDLPFPPETNLTEDQQLIVKCYCINDLVTTAIVYSELSEQISIRETMSEKYGIDLRSKSDAQIAEAVFKVELKKLGVNAQKTSILPGTIVKYKAPDFVDFESENLIQLVRDIEKANFVVKETGGLWIPDELIDENCRHYTDPKKREGRLITIGNCNYRMGIGGLHSCEEKVSFHADETFLLEDHDVASYYPAIILNCGLYPRHLGPNFLNLYRSLVDQRLKAKRSGNKIEADAIKITINGTFGKLGSKYSIFYSPNLLLQTTLTGQLCLLMLIEKLTSNGIQVCSANTDGIVVRYPKSLKPKCEELFKEWEKQTDFDTEKTDYRSIYISNVNNYIAVKPDGKAKLKGAYSIGEGIFRFHKNPTNSICVEAAVDFLTKDIPLRTTIKNCSDLSKFLTVRHVKGGAVKNKDYLGKAVRWYYSKTTPGEIIYASNGNKVPKSENSQPCMEMLDELPDDLDHARYEIEAIEILKSVSAI